MVNCTKPIQMLTPTPTPIPIICTSGKIADPGGTVAFIGVYGYVTITNPSGAEIVHSWVAGNTSFAACPSVAGTYTVRMNLVRPDCYTCSAAVPTTQPTQNVTVTPTPTPTPLEFTLPSCDSGDVPVANFTASPRSGTVPLLVSFNDTSAGLPVAWRWDFGDGNISTEQNPSHIYSVAGSYNVTLVVSNDDGCVNRTVKVGEVTVNALNQATDVEGRNVSIFIQNNLMPYPNYIEDIATKQNSMGYSAATMYYNQTTNMSGYIQNRLSNDEIFFIHSHGLEGGGVMEVDEDTGEYYYATNGPYRSPYKISEFTTLSNLRLAILLGCYTGLTNSYYGNLVDAIRNKGGQCAMGWTEDLDSLDSSIYGEAFWNQMDGETTPLYAHDIAENAVRYNQTCINMYADYLNTSTPKDEYCNYDTLYSNGTGCNSDLSVATVTSTSTFAAPAFALEINAKSAKNSVNTVSTSSLISLQNAIRNFTNNQKTNLTFEKRTHYSSADLYEFDSDHSSHFTVNSATGRVQSAIWNEVGSKSQKEIINLDQGAAIAEAFAKEKYPELWNISNSRCIKQTRKEILDRGGERQFRYEWAGSLYGPLTTGGSRTEVKDGNAVSVTVSPYTGHIVEYSELYLPAVFNHTALTNLTPIVTEEQAHKLALNEFRSLGVNVDQSREIVSLGLTTVVDKQNVPYQTWAFRFEHNEKNGKDNALVNVDVTNGRIIWSQKFDE